MYLVTNVAIISNCKIYWHYSGTPPIWMLQYNLPSALLPLYIELQFLHLCALYIKNRATFGPLYAVCVYFNSLLGPSWNTQLYLIKLQLLNYTVHVSACRDPIPSRFHTLLMRVKRSQNVSGDQDAQHHDRKVQKWMMAEHDSAGCKNKCWVLEVLKFRPREPHDIISKSRLSAKAPRGLHHQQIKLPQQSSQWQSMLETNQKIIHKVVNGMGDRYTLLNSISHWKLKWGKNLRSFHWSYDLYLSYQESRKGLIQNHAGGYTSQLNLTVKSSQDQRSCKRQPKTFFPTHCAEIS